MAIICGMLMQVLGFPGDGNLADGRLWQRRPTRLGLPIPISVSSSGSINPVLLWVDALLVGAAVAVWVGYQRSG
jgi:hypothetical protein